MCKDAIMSGSSLTGGTKRWHIVQRFMVECVVVAFILLPPSAEAGRERAGLSSISILHPACSYRQTSDSSTSSAGGTANYDGTL